MPVFSYKAWDMRSTKKELRGEIHADSLTLAKKQLRQERLLVTHIQLSKKSKEMQSLPLGILVQFTHAMAQLLQAGLPLYESLLAIEERMRRQKWHFLWVNLCDLVKAGSSMSAALSMYPSVFDPVYLSLVRAGEKSGSLTLVFFQLSQLLAQKQKRRKQLTSALLYPMILLCFCFLLLFLLLFFIIPSMRGLLEGRSVHGLTSLVLSVSSFFCEHSAVIGCGVVAAMILGYKWGKKAWQKGELQRLFCHVPLLRKLFLDLSFVRFFRSFSLLLLGGVSLVEALSLAAKTSPGLVGRMVEKMRLQVIEGGKMSDFLSSCSWVPRLIVRMVAMGEQTGDMVGVLKSLGDMYEEETEKNLQQIMIVLQPALLLLLGLVVGIVVLAILLPLTDVSSLIEG